MTEPANQQIEQPQSSKESLFRLVQLLLAGIGIFAALSYFLGRLRIEAYYYALGITPHVLQFSPEDYMFSSFNLVIMCLYTCYLLYEYFTNIRRGERMFLGFPIFRSSSKAELVNNILMMIWALLLAVLIFLNIYSGKGIGTNVPGFLGLSVGFAVGIAAILTLWFLETWVGKRAIYVQFIIIGFMLLAWLPSIATNIARIEAKSDIEKFPPAVLIYEKALPPQLQSSLDTPDQSKDVKIITTNNGMTYVLHQDNESTKKWQIYAIQENEIRQIIYLHGK